MKEAILIYIALGILFMLWENSVISADTETTEADKTAIRIIAVVAWLPVTIAVIRERMRK